MKFEDLDLDNNVLDALYDMRFEECTPIQEKCIPEILKGRDLLGIAQTGTGKTAAYLLPILSKLDSGNYAADAINCVIMSPTRELAQQIDQAMQGFGYYLQGVSSVAVYGGNDGNRYDQELKSMVLGADVIIATPGRLISHLSLGNLDLSHVSFFVLDEADRMLDMGFLDNIMTIAKHLPTNCQTLMFSATMPEKIEALAKTLLKNPVIVKLAVSKPAEKIKQSAYVCHEPQKLGIIRSLFKKNDLKRVIIFCGKKAKVKEVNRALLRMKINSGEMHSDLSQAERDEMMFRFKSGQLDVIVATDILARGIDIDDISMVINFDVPHDAEDYVHRIGRTARADKDGIAITFVNDDDIAYFKDIERFLGKEVPKNPLPEELGEGPEYKVQSRKAKSIRRDDRNKNAHRHKPKKEGGRPVISRGDRTMSDTSELNDRRKPRRNPSKEYRQKPQDNRENQPKNDMQPRQQGQSKQRQDRNRQDKSRRRGQEQRQVHSQGQQNSKPKRNVEPKKQQEVIAPKTSKSSNTGLKGMLRKSLNWLKSLGKK